MDECGKKEFMLLNKEADRTLLHSLLDECWVIDVRTIMIHNFTI